MYTADRTMKSPINHDSLVSHEEVIWVKIKSTFSLFPRCKNVHKAPNTINIKEAPMSTLLILSTLSSCGYVYTTKVLNNDKPIALLISR